MEVFFSSIVIKKLEDKVGALYRPDTADPKTKKVEVVGLGPGLYNQEKGEYEGMPFKVGDQLVVVFEGWTEIDCEPQELWRIDMHHVIKRVG